MAHHGTWSCITIDNHVSWYIIMRHDLWSWFMIVHDSWYHDACSSDGFQGWIFLTLVSQTTRSKTGTTICCTKKTSPMEWGNNLNVFLGKWISHPLKLGYIRLDELYTKRSRGDGVFCVSFSCMEACAGAQILSAQKVFPGHGTGNCIRFNGKPGSTPTLLQWQAARRVSVSLARNNFPMAKTGVSNHFNGTAWRGANCGGSTLEDAFCWPEKIPPRQSRQFLLVVDGKPWRGVRCVISTVRGAVQELFSPAQMYRRDNVKVVEATTRCTSFCRRFICRRHRETFLFGSHWKSYGHVPHWRINRTGCYAKYFL